MANFPIEISARHVHLTESDWTALFGPAEMKKDHELSQRPNFTATQRVTIRGPKGELKGVAIVGPCRPYTQVELSITDARFVGITPPLSDSGDLKNAATITIIGSRGEIVKAAAIIQKRHLHIDPAQASKLGLKKNQVLSMGVPGPRGAVISNVFVRVHPNFNGRLQLDTDEGNALGVTPGMTAEILV
ncbi:MAG: propanediol utilization protein [Candidatus Kerfeldbacteria bacterium]|nr:propanediol utilization protein [Candidatus Kerfeldbacteria bacterium]